MTFTDAIREACTNRTLLFKYPKLFNKLKNWRLMWEVQKEIKFPKDKEDVPVREQIMEIVYNNKSKKAESIINQIYGLPKGRIYNKKLTKRALQITEHLRVSTNIKTATKLAIYLDNKNSRDQCNRCFQTNNSEHTTLHCKGTKLARMVISKVCMNSNVSWSDIQRCIRTITNISQEGQFNGICLAISMCLISLANREKVNTDQTEREKYALYNTILQYNLHRIKIAKQSEEKFKITKEI